MKKDLDRVAAVRDAIGSDLRLMDPFRDELPNTSDLDDKGVLTVRTGPGLGIEIDRAVLERYRVA